MFNGLKKEGLLATPAISQEVQTPAWRMIGATQSAPGVLALHNGQISYTEMDGHVFETPLSAVADVAFPWYYFGGGAKVTVNGVRYRFSFVKPNGAMPVSQALQERVEQTLGTPQQSGSRSAYIWSGRKAGKLWKSILETVRR
jgi:hypothetical protein